MKKKFVPIILALLLILTACTVNSSQQEKELGYFSYSDFEWGMNEEEFVKKLGVSEENFSITVDNESLSKTYALQNAEFLDNDAEEVSWTFLKKSEGESYFLYGVTAKYTNIVSPNDMIEKMSSEVRKQEVSAIETTERVRFEGDRSINVFDDETLYADGADVVWMKYTLSSKSTVFDLPEELYSNAKAGFEKNAKNTEFEGLFDCKPLSTASVWYICNMNADDSVMIVSIFGTIAQIKAFAE